jgi:hypothetical protein
MLQAARWSLRSAAAFTRLRALPVGGPGASRSLASFYCLGVAGCVVAIGVGAAATTHRGLLVAAVLGVGLFCAGAVALYQRDPVLAFIWLWLFEIFNAPLSASVGYFSKAGEAVRQADELLVLLFLGLTLIRIARSSTRMPSLRIVLPGLGFAIFGVLGAVEHRVPLSIAAVGTWLGIKLWVSLLVGLALPWQRSDQRRVYRVLAGVGLFVAFLGLLDYLTHEAISRALHTSIYQFSSGTARGEAVHSIFPHPGEFSLFMSLLFAFAFARFASKHSKADLVLAICFAASVMLSLRLKGFLALAAVVALVTVARGGIAGRRGVAIAFVGLLLLVGGYEVEGSVISTQLKTYTSSESSARARLYMTGNHIAADDLPLGVGFGRFATYVSRLHYSPVYQEYGLNRVWGLSREFPNFIDDTSWPGVIGEAGYGGLACYLAGILFLIALLVRRMRSASPEEVWLPLAALAALVAFLVDSLGDPTLFDWLATTSLVMLVGPALAVGTVAARARVARRVRADEPAGGPLPSPVVA